MMRRTQSCSQAVCHLMVLSSAKKWLQTTSSKKNCLPQTRERSPDLRAACMHYNTIKLRRGGLGEGEGEEKNHLVAKKGQQHTVVRVLAVFLFRSEEEEKEKALESKVWKKFNS